MNNIYILSDLAVGERARIEKLRTSSDSMRRRLCDIGLIEGTIAECVLKSPSKDPTAYLVRGAVIALRKCDTDEIIVSIQGGVKNE